MQKYCEIFRLAPNSTYVSHLYSHLLGSDFTGCFQQAFLLFVELDHNYLSLTLFYIIVFNLVFIDYHLHLAKLLEQTKPMFNTSDLHKLQPNQIFPKALVRKQDYLTPEVPIYIRPSHRIEF